MASLNPETQHFLDPLERGETLGSRVRDLLRDAIMTGVFKPGEKLTLRSVATTLGVSLTPVREALLNLGADGTLDSNANGSLSIPLLDDERLVELTRIRLSIEGLAAREAVKHLTDKDVIRISAVNDALVEANQRKDYGVLIKCNWKFHFMIYEAARMPFLDRMISSCWLRAGSYFNVIYPDFATTDAGILHHLAMLRAIRARDGEALAKAIGQDIQAAFIALEATLKKR